MSMNKWIVLLSFLIMAYTTAVAAQSLTGRVVDNRHAPLEAVSVVLLEKSSKKPLAFTRTDADGHFALSYLENKAGTLTFNLLGYAKDTIDVQSFKPEQTIVLKEQSYNLKEVKIKAPRIAQRGDTLTYSVNVFKQQQDRSIADVIAKMPGLQVNEDGTIEYQGRRINKFYIEGMDMLGSKYAQVSENLSADKIKSVQVYENHQNIKMLRGLSFSEQAALNIVLRDDAKNVWQGMVDLGAGSSLQKDVDFLCDSRLNSMLFSRKMQTFSLYKFNNSGAELKEGINLRKFFGYGMPEASDFVDNISLDVPDLNPSRTRINQTHILSSNWLFKTSKDTDLRFQLSGVFDNTQVEEEVITEYTDIAPDNRIAEYSYAKSLKNFASGELLYRVNSDRLFLTNNFSTSLTFDRGTGTSLVNSQQQDLYVKPHKRTVSDELEMINKLKNGKHLNSRAYFSYNYLPSKLLTANGGLQELNQIIMFWGATTAFSHPLGRINAQYSIGNEGFTQHAEENNSQLALNYVQHTTKAAIELYRQNEKLSWNIRLPLALLAQSLDKGKHQRLEFEPYLSLTYKPNARWSFTSTYSYSEQPTDGLESCQTPLFTSYLVQKSGNGSFYNMKMHTSSLHVTFKNVRYGLFASLRAGYNYCPDNMLYAHQLDGIVYHSIATAYRRDGSTFHASGKFTKDFGGNVSVGVNAYISQSRSYSLWKDNPVANRFRNINTSFSFSYRPCAWFSVEEKSFLFHTKSKREQTGDLAAYNQSTNTFNHTLDLFFTPKKWTLQWKNEFYHSNDQSASFNFFSDLSISYKLKDCEISLCLNNLIGNDTYERRVIKSDFITHTVNRLRPREFIIKYSFAL